MTLQVQQNKYSIYTYDRDIASLHRKIRLVLNSIPVIRPIKTDIENIKWFGDKASHESSLTITRGDIKDTLAPKIRLFLGKTNEV